MILWEYWRVDSEGSEDQFRCLSMCDAGGGEGEVEGGGDLGGFGGFAEM